MVERLAAGYQERPVSELLTALLEQSGYEAMLRTEGSQERLDNLAELKQSVYDYETSCGEECTAEHYLSRVALLTNADADSGRNAVRLMTVHTAKGLEFPHVFLCGLAEGVFPSKKAATLAAVEEERRLAFVAFTRAQRGLYLSAAAGRNLDGSCRYPSRFIFNVDRSLLDCSGDLDESLAQATRAEIASQEKMLAALATAPAFHPGDRIAHSVLGTGEIVSVDRDQSAYVIRFDSTDTPRTINFRARLELAR